MNLVDILKEQTQILFWNLENSINTVPEDKIGTILYDAPIWWYIYHTLHSLDKWFINPTSFNETISEKSEFSKEDLTAYFYEIKEKINSYLENLTDDILLEKPEGCSFTRMALILGQYRHSMVHVGILSGAMIYEIGKFPRYFGMEADAPKGNEAKYYDDI